MSVSDPMASNGSNFPDRVHVRPVTVLKEHKREILGVCFSPDGTTLVSSDGKVMLFWQIDSTGVWKFQRSLTAQALFPRFSPNGTMLAFRDGKNNVQMWTKEGEYLATLQSERQGQLDGIFSPDGKFFLTGDLQGKIQVWDVETFQLRVTFEIIPKEERDRPLFWSRQFCFAPDGKRFVFLSPSKQGWVHLCAFDSSSAQISWEKTLSVSSTNDLKVSPTGSMLAVSNIAEESVGVYEMESLRLATTFPMEGGPAFLAFSPDGQFLASNKDDGTVCIWSMQTQGLAASFAAHPGLWTEQADAIGGLDWSRQGNFIATGGASFFLHDQTRYDYTIKIWKVEQDDQGKS